jgi:hypothetical protein
MAGAGTDGDAVEADVKQSEPLKAAIDAAMARWGRHTYVTGHKMKGPA